jgi:hypothetical protein
MARITIATLRAAAKPFGIIVEKVDECTLEIFAPAGKVFGGEDGFRSRYFEWMKGCADWRRSSMEDALHFITEGGPDMYREQVEDEEDSLEGCTVCPVCLCSGIRLGTLGDKTHFRCRGCGINFYAGITLAD